MSFICTDAVGFSVLEKWNPEVPLNFLRQEPVPKLSEYESYPLNYIHLHLPAKQKATKLLYFSHANICTLSASWRLWIGLLLFCVSFCMIHDCVLRELDAETEHLKVNLNAFMKGRYIVFALKLTAKYI